MDTTRNSARSSSPQQQTVTPTSANATNKHVYSAPASPASSEVSGAVTAVAPARTATPTGSSSSISPSPSLASPSPSHSPSSANSSPASGAPADAAMRTIYSSSDASVATAPAFATVLRTSSLLSTPKKNFLDAVMLKTIREKLMTPGGACELHSLRLEYSSEPVNVVKDRYLISVQSEQAIAAAAAAAQSPASYRPFIDLTSSYLKCTDVFTEQEFLCKIINEPLDKVQCAYFRLQQEGDHCRSSLYGHPLIRAVHDIVPMSRQRTYVIIATPDCHPRGDAGDEGVYEDLHTYIRSKRRLCETEARALFHQICETVRVCHRNGIILRDLKLKRFYFIDEARTKLQYESLEGSMILDDPADDTLSDKIGCPLYTAPELLCPDPTYKGKPADMWSLGVILYTMLVGQYPFTEKGNSHLIAVIRLCHVQIPSSLSKPVRWLLLSLLRKNYTERMRADHIFFSPWLREQRPYYMSIPADIYIPDEELEQQDQQLQQQQHQQQQQAHEKHQQQQNHSQHTAEAMDHQSSGGGGGGGGEALDYTRLALQVHRCPYDVEDVDMG